MPVAYSWKCTKCRWRGTAYRNVRTCKKCGAPLEHDWRAEADALGLGSLVIGHRKLIEEPLNESDWAEVFRAYLALQHHLKLIAFEVRKRKAKEE